MANPEPPAKTGPSDADKLDAATKQIADQVTTIADLEKIIAASKSEIAELVTERDEWKRRAEVAEETISAAAPAESNSGVITADHTGKAH